jgi:hypothetical protein
MTEHPVRQGGITSPNDMDCAFVLIGSSGIASSPITVMLGDLSSNYVAGIDLSTIRPQSGTAPVAGGIATTTVESTPQFGPGTYHWFQSTSGTQIANCTQNLLGPANLPFAVAVKVRPSTGTYTGSADESTLCGWVDQLVEASS